MCVLVLCSWVLPRPWDTSLAGVHGEPGDVAAGVLETDVGRDQPVQVCQHMVGAGPVDQFALCPEDGLGKFRVGPGILRPVQVQKQPVSVEIEHEQFVHHVLHR